VRDNEECIKEWFRDGESLVDAFILWSGSLNGKSDRCISRRNRAELMKNGKFIDDLTGKNS
jgi:hypothetical protein